MTAIRSLSRNRAKRLGLTALAAAVMVAATACGSGDSAQGPVLPPNPEPVPGITKAAFILNIDAKSHRVRITKPSVSTASLGSGLGASSLESLAGDEGGPDFSILAGDVIDLTTSNYVASAVGQFTPNKIRVKFDVSVTNQLSGVQITTPTFPTPPAGASGVLLFPFATNVTVTSGGVSVGGDGTDVIITLPNTGQVAPSTDWDGDGSPGSGTPANFFNDTGCPAGSNDCYRWEAYPVPIAPGATTTARTIGFDIDPTVGNFQAKLIIAGDLQNSGPAPVGTIAGTVTSAALGPLNGVTITATPGSGFTGTTAGAGAYSIANVAIGPKTVAITGGLPASCTNPGSQSATVTNGGTATVNFTVVCAAAAGSVSGSITRTGAGTQSLAGVIATATPAASGTSPATGTATGAASPFSYSITGVAIGSGAGAGNGSVTLSNLPAGCTAPAAGTYTGLTNGGSQTVNFSVACAVPPAFYQYSATWGSITGGSVSVTLRFDPSTLNSPTVNGAAADDFNAIQLTLSYSPTRLTFGSCANSSGSSFTNITANSPSAGTISLLNFKTGAGSVAAQDVATCTFTVTAGAATSVTTSSALEVISSFNGDDLIPNTQKNEGTLTIP